MWRRSANSGSLFTIESTRSLSCFQRFLFFTSPSVMPAPLNNCFSFFKELHFKVNNVRNYLKYTRRACHFLSSCVGSTVFLPATVRSQRSRSYQHQRHPPIIDQQSFTVVHRSLSFISSNRNGFFSPLLLQQLKVKVVFFHLCPRSSLLDYKYI